MKKNIILIAVLFSILWTCNIAFGAIIVGRITHVEGQIYRYMDTDQSWVETFVESPAGTQDVLAAGADSRAEIVFPISMALKLDENAEVEILNLDEDEGSFVLHAGLARFYNRSSAGILDVETARGLVRVTPGSIIDLRADGDAVIVAAVSGEATFRRLKSDAESIEVISGSSSLEFRPESIVAGVGPIDRNWDRWCADREKDWAQNRQVRSEYLPESMQEYAYALEPHGTWRRIYYRGYYYWAWKPHHVAVGWAPYTTGVWYDWQGGPVWIDRNPWGWATHHHGHWIHLQGAWMWTPYVHVSHVRGVTVAGFNIRFGRKYRPYWHPGRVRWIAHSSYVGWLPLAPWETYYGYRSWGSRSVVVQGGASFSINLNLSNHRYIDHAVIIPKHHFQQRGKPAVINYNTVNIRNINKTVIVKNYKPVPTVSGRKDRKYGEKITGDGKVKKSAGINSNGRTAKNREAVTVQNNKRKIEPVIRAQKKVMEKRIVQERRTEKVRLTASEPSAGTVERKREQKRGSVSQAGAARPGKRAQVRKLENRETNSASNTIVAGAEAKKTIAGEKKSSSRKKEPRQTVAESGNMAKAGQKNKNAALSRNSSGSREQALKQSHLPKRQVQKNEGYLEQSHQKNTLKYAAKEKPDARQRERQVPRTQKHRALQNTQREQQKKRQEPGKNIVSARRDNQRFR